MTFTFQLLSPTTTDTRRVSRIRTSADIFGKRFITLCLWRKCKISKGSPRRDCI